jgi:hypothetical protein
MCVSLVDCSGFMFDGLTSLNESLSKILMLWFWNHINNDFDLKSFFGTRFLFRFESIMNSRIWFWFEFNFMVILPTQGPIVLHLVKILAWSFWLHLAFMVNVLEFMLNFRVTHMHCLVYASFCWDKYSHNN